MYTSMTNDKTVALLSVKLFAYKNIIVWNMSQMQMRLSSDPLGMATTELR